MEHHDMRADAAPAARAGRSVGRSACTVLVIAVALVGLLIVLNGREPYGGLPEP